MPNWGVYLPTYGASAPIDVPGIRRLAARAEERGLAHLFVGDHLIWNRAILSPFLALAHVAAVTERIRLGTGVYLLPLRAPVLAAKDAATLDVLSGGRLILGVGAGGDNPEEYRVAGVAPGNRGTRMDEGIAALRGLLNGEPSGFVGNYVEVPPTTLAPLPRRSVPIWLGGRSEAVVQRAARVCDGWFPVWISPERYATARDQILGERKGNAVFDFGLNIFVAIADTRAEARAIAAVHMENAYAQPFERFERYVAYGTPDDVRKELRPYVEVGVTDVVFNLTGPRPEHQLDLLTREVIC